MDEKPAGGAEKRGALGDNLAALLARQDLQPLVRQDDESAFNTEQFQLGRTLQTQERE